MKKKNTNLALIINLVLVINLVFILSGANFADTFTSHVKPNTDSSLDIGTSSLFWRYLYADSITDGTFLVSDGIISAGIWHGSTVEVPYGGTGATSLTDGGLLVGSGTSAITALAVAANGEIPIGDGSGDPVLATLTGTASEIDITNDAGSIIIGIVDPLTVSKGGTGAATLTDGGILLGSGTSAITALGVASNGQIPIGDGATDPVLATITGSSAITVTNGAGSITLDVNDTGVDHGGLSGLSDQADHTWALYEDGTNPLTGNWAVGGFDITGVNTLSATTLKVSSDTGVALTGSNGVLTMAGIGDGQDENLTFNFNSTANTVTIGTTTGVTLLSLGGINFKTTGNINTGTFGVGATFAINGNVITDTSGSISFSDDNIGGSGDTDFLSGILGRGLLLENDECVLNGTFASDTVWTKLNGWTIAGGVANCALTGLESGALTQDLNIQTLQTYCFEFDITADASAGSDENLVVTLGGVAVDTIALGAATGSYSYCFTATSTAVLSFDAEAAAEDEELDVSIDNVSVKQISMLKTETRLGSATNYTQIDSAGDVVFVGGGGLAFGEIYVKDNAVATTLNSTAKVQITVFGANGVSNNATPDHTNDHITITKAGIYKATISLHVNNNAAQTHIIDVSLWKNNGATEFPNVHGHRTLTGGSGDVGSMSMSGLIDLNVNDTIEVWADTDVAADRLVTFEDICLNLVQVGGT